MSNRELLLEVGTEEIPANFIGPALGKMKDLAISLFKEERLEFGEVHCYATPRRLVLHVTDLSERQAAFSKEVVGPSKTVSFDPTTGQPTKAAIGFATGQGVDISDLKIKKTQKGEYVSIIKMEEQKETALFLSELLPRLISSTTFPKMMRWDGSGIPFVRPIRWIMAVYNERLVGFEFAGLRSQERSYGHRFMAQNSFKVKDFKSYKRLLEKNFVIIDQGQRRGMIEDQLRIIADKKKGKILKDEELIDQAVYMVEYPESILGSFDPRFLGLPKELPINAMKEHQGYFSLADKEERLLPYFISVCNIKSEDMELIRRGNERVLAARLSDAAFYFEKDKALRFEGLIEGLRGVIFQERLGSLYEKTERISGLSVYLAGIMGNVPIEKVNRAAQLCKVDLLTGVVREFPKLQGIMGREYALIHGEEADVARAIDEHYLPRFAGDLTPSSLIGAIISVADKIDTITGCFCIGLIPSGSEDPYALRRQGIGVVQILVEKLQDVSLPELIDRSIGLLSKKINRDADKVKVEVTHFLKQRMEHILSTKGIRYDLIDAVLSSRFDRPSDFYNRAQALSAASKEEGFDSLMTSFKRAINIIPKDFTYELNLEKLKEPAERQIYDAFKTIETKMGHLVGKGMYKELLKEISMLRGP
ncbi:MAG: glycine--tRNA ligase subunit beta, partial [Nitrospirota bacterium]